MAGGVLIRRGEQGGGGPDRLLVTGHTAASLAAVIADRTSFADFIAHAPALNPARALITGVVCGVRVEDIEEQPMREIRYLDKLVDELAKGKAMGKILRG